MSFEPKDYPFGALYIATSTTGEVLMYARSYSNERHELLGVAKTSARMLRLL